MTAAISIYGRLGQDPKPITTKSGKAMATASVAVEIPTRGEDAHSEWFGLVAFGEVAERLLKHQKGEMVSVSGRLQMNVWQDKEGNDRQQWQVLVDTLISARTVRPGGRKPGNGQQGHQQRHDRQEAYRASQDYQSPRRPAPSGNQDDGYRNRYRAPQPEFNDPIPF